ncbi:MAG: VWA domain-containing protein [Propionibacteriaceae bacterium]|nr:VWA domain-containing protein [Propionibacteriaceae bacterium]
MALTQPWYGLAVLVLLAAVGIAAWLWPRRRRSTSGALLLANAGRVRSLPRFAQLTRERLRWLVIESCCLAVAGAGVALLAARPVSAETVAQERSNRDIVLCLDVSGSMSQVNRDVIASFTDLAAELDGERIGFVLFDSSAVTVFPLTDDAAYIQQHLRETAEDLGGGQVAGTRVGDLGSSLIGDGLASCLQRFDQADARRSRTVVLATDNQVAGTPLFSLSDAARRAVERDVLVQGIVPSDNSVAATDDLTSMLELTGGGVMLLGPQPDIGSITRAVESQQRAVMAGRARTQSVPLVWPGAVVALLGLGGASLAHRRRASS